MNDEIREILEKPNVYSFADETYLYFGDYNKLKYYITKLQQENERLKKENKHIFANVNDDELLISNAINYAEAQDYKSRIEKAVEYIKKNKLYNFSYDKEEIFYTVSDKKARNKLLNILQNGSDE